MSIIWKKLKIKMYSMTATKPTQKLIWSQEDYEKGERWAKGQPHPFLKNKTLWDFCYDKVDSTRTIHNINKFLFNEI
jgi:hypothetical protein